MNKKIVLSLLLGLAIVCTVHSLHTASAGGEIIPYYTDTYSVRANLSFEGDVAVSSGSITPKKSNEVRKAVVNVFLQRKESGKWKTVQPWLGTNNNDRAEAGGRVTVSKGYDYRTYVVGRIYDAEGLLLERVTITSAIVHH